MNAERSILLIEDDIVDILTVKRALKDMNMSNPLIVKRNGLEALEYLKTLDTKEPMLILLDINMPKMNGIEFLREFRAIERLATIPVVVLTTSRDRYDRLASFKLHCSGYMIKPVAYSQFLESMKTIKKYWEMSEFPS